MRAGFLVLLLIAAAQDPRQTFRSATELVEVDVRVVGKDGHFVTGLTATDFELAEDGVPQKIVNVTLIDAPEAPAPVAPLAPVAPAPAAPLAPLAPLAPAQVWLFVFDTTHLSPGGLQRTRDAVVKFITEKFHQGDVGGVVVDGRMANNRLTSDREELRLAAAGVKFPGNQRARQLELQEWPRLRDALEAARIVNGERDALDAAVTRACADDPDACRRAPPDLQVREKANRVVAEERGSTLETLRVVEALSGGLARMPGAKTVVFLSEGFVLQSMEAELRHAVGQAARAGAHFYTVDARGLNKGTNSELIDQALADNPSGGGVRFDMQEDGTNSLAVDTGGIAIRNENNFGRALDTIQRDAATYYVLAYSPTNDTLDGKYRSILVKVARPDVRVRARRGYLALAPARLLIPRPEPVTTPALPPINGTAPFIDEKRGQPPLFANKGDSRPADAPAPADPVTPTATVVQGATTAANAIRSKIDSGRIVQQLRGSDDGVATTATARGWAAYQRGDVETASREFLDAVKSPDAQPWVYYALGLSHLALQRYRDAAQSWERVRAAAPEFEPVYFNLADAYLLQHEEGAAIGVLRNAERRWTADPEVANAIGVIQVRRGALDAAIDSFGRATTIAPDDALGYFNLGRALQMRMLKSQRYVRETQKWVGGDSDRRRAIASLEKYVQLGGPYVPQAREALASLAWK
jgi:VWFA-related protein